MWAVRIHCALGPTMLYVGILKLPPPLAISKLVRVERRGTRRAVASQDKFVVSQFKR